MFCCGVLLADDDSMAATAGAGVSFDLVPLRRAFVSSLGSMFRSSLRAAKALLLAADLFVVDS